MSIVILTGSYSCKKYHPPKPDNPYGLPDATQTGAETFACLIDGKLWIAKYVGGPTGAPDIDGIYDYRGFAVSGTTRVKDFEYLSIAVKTGKIELNRVYDLSNTALSYALMRTIGDSCFRGNGGYGGGESNTYATKGSLIITRADSVHKIISGIFSCEIPSDYCDTLKITDGRFDIRYY